MNQRAKKFAGIVSRNRYLIAVGAASAVTALADDAVPFGSIAATGVTTITAAAGAGALTLAAGIGVRMAFRWAKTLIH